MAAIDSLLRVLTSRNADALALAADQAPKMTRAGATEPLTMPPLSAQLLETFLGEVLSAEQQAEARAQGSVTTDYGEFSATARFAAGRWTLAFKKRPPARGAVAAAAPPPPPPPPLSWGAPPPPAVGGDPARWLARALAENATDLILSTGRPARLRVGGALVELPGDPPAERDLLELLAPALTPAAREHLAKDGAADVALVWDGADPPARFRVNLFRQAHGLAAALRPIRRDPPALADLDLPESLARLAGFPNGLVLVVGPTGSGKSTTLVALVEHLNRTAARHVITLEDPIEFEHGPGRALVHQREVGAHIESFEAGLRAALREAPDVILVGEMRDRPTIAAALTAAETGHLVLSTLHAAGAAMAVERIVDAFPEHQQRQVRGQLAGTLRAILTQHLLPRAGGGLVPAIELALGTPALAALVREGKTHQIATVIQTGRDEGMIPLDRSLAERVEKGKVTVEAATAVTSDAGAQLRVLLSRRQGGL
jgi:twitching motility protein PilT